MAEVLGIVGSVIAIIQISGVITKYGKDFKNAPKEMEALEKTLVRLEQLAERLEGHYNGGLADTEHKQQVQEVEWDDDDYICGILTDLKDEIEEIWIQLNPQKDWKNKKAYKRFSWHSVKPNVIQTNVRIDSALVRINISLGLDISQKIDEKSRRSDQRFDELASGVRTIQDEQKAERQRRALQEEQVLTDQIVHWLSPLSFIDKRENLYNDCFRETGKWLWEDEVFLSWTRGSPWLLECRGRPMVGKTVLSSILDYYLRTKNQNNFVVLSIFLDYKDTARQTVPNLIASLLKQLIQQDDQAAISQSLKDMFHKAKRRERSSNSYLDEIVALLKTELKRYDRIYIIVDGLDENPEWRDLMTRLCRLDPARVSLITFARIIALPGELYGSRGCDRCGQEGLRMYLKCKICYGEHGGYDLCLDCKSRGDSCLNATHRLNEPYGSRTIPIEIPSEDIEGYVRWQIGLDAQNDQALARDSTSAAPEQPNTNPLQDILQEHPDLTQRIVEEVAKNANGEFLTARLYMDAIKEAPTARAVTRILRGLPEKKTEDIYRDAIGRLDRKKDQVIAFQVLSLVTRARRSLSMEELRHALAFIEADLAGDPIQNNEILKEALPYAKTILDSTTGLVIAENREAEIRLVHRTFEKYIKDNEKHLKWFSDSVAQPARACLDYIQFVLSEQKFQNGIAEIDKYPFLMYVSQYWGDHVREATVVANPDESIQTACMKLLNNAGSLGIVMQAAWNTNASGLDTWDVWNKVDKLHVCAWYGLSFAVGAMSPGKAQANIREPKYGQTPLMYACRKGHRKVVRQLLASGASCAIVSARGRTAVFEAVMGQHDDLVEDLVDCRPSDLNINATNEKEFERSVLIIAARQGSTRMVKALLKYPGINIDQQDVYGMTALYLAAKYRHGEVVDQLLEAKADLELVDFTTGRSPLRVAAERNHDEIVESLLYHKANPNATDHIGSTAMFYAAYRGALQALDLMLTEFAGGDVEAVDEIGQNLLHSASGQGHVDVVRRLIDMLDPNKADYMKMTPLHVACREGRATAVSLLLESGRVDSSLKDEDERTPKIIAWQYGHPEIVHILEVHESKSSATLLVPVPSDDSLPIWSMARRGLLDLLPEAIRTRPQELSIKEPGRQNTALQNAIECKAELVQPEIVDLVLSSTHAAISINEVNRVGRSALHTAAICGDIISTQRLIASADIDLDAQDRWHATPLVLAQSNWHYQVMLELVKAEATIDKRKIDAQKLFFYAVGENDIEAVQVLLNIGVDPSLQNEEGLRASQMAESDAMTRILDRARTLVFEGEPKKNNGPLDRFPIVTGEGDKWSWESDMDMYGEPENVQEESEVTKAKGEAKNTTEEPDKLDCVREEGQDDEKRRSLPIRSAHQSLGPNEHFGQKVISACWSIFLCTILLFFLVLTRMLIHMIGEWYQ